ncbi:MAG: hypothetical protein JSU63_07075 [Phycisphaerales bacterium]|nr:MAG: hypothetical protein JSU63_07075 [Phycisphaerales bacterium]
MMHLLFVGDGPRDAATVPILVKRILNATIEPVSCSWHSVRVKGYKRKVLYMIRRVRDQGADGLVATLDADKERKGRRLREMCKGRDADREKYAPVRTALGEAAPHGEAWLLQDPVAVREGMELPNEVQIPSLRKTKDPKEALHRLLATSPRSEDRPVHVWADIAGLVQPERYKFKKNTGFGTFEKDVRDELGPLVTSRAD